MLRELSESSLLHQMPRLSNNWQENVRECMPACIPVAGSRARQIMHEFIQRQTRQLKVVAVGSYRTFQLGTNPNLQLQQSRAAFLQPTRNWQKGLAIAALNFTKFHRIFQTLVPCVFKGLQQIEFWPTVAILLAGPVIAKDVPIHLADSCQNGHHVCVHVRERAPCSHLGEVVWRDASTLATYRANLEG